MNQELVCNIYSVYCLMFKSAVWFWCYCFVCFRKLTVFVCFFLLFETLMCWKSLPSCIKCVVACFGIEHAGYVFHKADLFFSLTLPAVQKFQYCHPHWLEKSWNWAFKHLVFKCWVFLSELKQESQLLLRKSRSYTAFSGTAVPHADD